MRTHRLISSFTPIAVAGIFILGTGCAKTSPAPGADTTLHRDSTSSVSQNPENNAVGQRDNYNARTSTTDTGAALGSTNDTIQRGGPPVPRGQTTKRP